MSWLKVFTSRRLFEPPSAYCVAARRRGRGRGGGGGRSRRFLRLVASGETRRPQSLFLPSKQKFTKHGRFPLSQSFGCPAGGSVAASPTESQISRQTRRPSSPPAASTRKFCNFYTQKLLSGRPRPLRAQFPRPFPTKYKRYFKDFDGALFISVESA